MIFLFWKLILTTWGSTSAPIFHAYLIGAQILCAVLLFRLVRDLAHDRGIAAVAALLFATYPFSYQALTWSTAQSHPTNLALVLICAILYRRAREKAGSPFLYLAAAACLIAAMLVHESAYVGAVIVLVIEAYLFFDHRVRRMSLWPLLYLIITVAVYALYRSVAKAQPVEATLQPETGLYLLQGLIYPIAMLLARTCTAFGCDSPAWLLPAAGGVALVAVLMWRSGRTLMLGVLGLVWFGLEILPVWGRIGLHLRPICTATVLTSTSTMLRGSVGFTPFGPPRSGPAISGLGILGVVGDTGMSDEPRIAPLVDRDAGLRMVDEWPADQRVEFEHKGLAIVVQFAVLEGGASAQFE